MIGRLLTPRPWKAPKTATPGSGVVLFENRDEAEESARAYRAQDYSARIHQRDIRVDGWRVTVWCVVAVAPATIAAAT